VTGMKLHVKMTVRRTTVQQMTVRLGLVSPRESFYEPSFDKLPCDEVSFDERSFDVTSQMLRPFLATQILTVNGTVLISTAFLGVRLSRDKKALQLLTTTSCLRVLCGNR